MCTDQCVLTLLLARLAAVLEPPGSENSNSRFDAVLLVTEMEEG